MFLNWRRNDYFFFYLLGFLYQSKGNIIFRKDVCLAEPTESLFKSFSHGSEKWVTQVTNADKIQALYLGARHLCLVFSVPSLFLFWILHAQEGSPTWPHEASLLTAVAVDFVLFVPWDRALKRWRRSIFFFSIPNSPIWLWSGATAFSYHQIKGPLRQSLV